MTPAHYARRILTLKRQLETEATRTHPDGIPAEAVARRVAQLQQQIDWLLTKMDHLT